MNFLYLFARDQYRRALRDATYIRAFLKVFFFKSGFQVGDLVCKRGGYVQDYYQVVAMVGRTGIVLRQIAMFIRPADEYRLTLQSNSIPAKDHFVGSEEVFEIAINREWSSPKQRVEFQPGIEGGIHTYRKVNGRAIFHPYVPGVELSRGGLSPSIANAQALPPCMQRITVDNSRCIAVPDFDAFAWENDRTVSAAMASRR